MLDSSQYRPNHGYLLSRAVAQSGSALAWGARGRKFESCRPDHFKTPQSLLNKGSRGFCFFALAKKDSHALSITLTKMPFFGQLFGQHFGQHF